MELRETFRKIEWKKNPVNSIEDDLYEYVRRIGEYGVTTRSDEIIGRENRSRGNRFRSYSDYSPPRRNRSQEPIYPRAELNRYRSYSPPRRNRSQEPIYPSGQDME